MFDIEFWRNFPSNALATFVGVIIGIPAALWINRIQQKVIDATEQKKSQMDATARRTKILHLLIGELNENLVLLNKISDDLQKHSDEFKYDNYRLRVELWNSFSDGGELH